MIYQQALYTRNQIDAAKPVISLIAGYAFAHCLSARISSWTNTLFIADYTELFAWECEDRYSGNQRRR